MITTFNGSQNIFAKFYNSIQDFITEVSNRKTKIQMVRNTIRELNSLTDRDLRDIGLSRYDIEMIAKEHVSSLESK